MTITREHLAMILSIVAAVAEAIVTELESKDRAALR
jgi:hypothetical protein